MQTLMATLKKGAGWCSISLGILIMMGFGMSNSMAAEIAPDPGDYAPAPPGTDLGIIYYQHVERKENYANGSKTTGAFGLDTDIGLARWVHFTKIGDYTINPQVIVPFGSVRLKTPFGPLQATSASGVGDPIAGATLWLVNRPEDKQWFGVSAFASIPIGNYDAAKGPVNVGENRWKGIFHAGYVVGIAEHVLVDVIGEYAVYGQNSNFIGMKKEQDAGTSIVAMLRYVLSPSSHLAMSYIHDWGGETKLNGVAQRDKKNNDRWLATYATFVTPSVQAQFQFGQGLKVENGPKEDSRFNLRIIKVF